MRQVGILGAAGLFGLNKMVQRLHLDHENADYLASKFSQIKELDVDNDRLDINMVFIKSTLDFMELSEFLQEKGILFSGSRGKRTRIAVHNDISRENIDQLVELIKEFVSK